jgi:hypothetical protein
MNNKKENPFEGLESLKVVDFEIVSEISPNQLAVDLKNNEGISVESVYFPPNFTPDRTNDEAMNWLQEKVYSTKIAHYNHKSKYSEDY